MTKLDYEPRRVPDPGARRRARVRWGWMVAFLVLIPLILLAGFSGNPATFLLVVFWLLGSMLAIKLYASRTS